MEIKCSRRLFLGKRGFTLIELLVVVLIIGILAAVALPQYHKAVYKAQFAEVLIVAEALDKALTIYYLEHGNYGNEDGSGPVRETGLSIDIPVLKHFKFQNLPGATLDYEFQAGSVGNVSNPQDYAVTLNSDQGNVSIFLTWLRGKKWRFGCSSSASSVHPNCADFLSECPAPQLGTDGMWSSYCHWYE